jgi:hypothetical protein
LFFVITLGSFVIYNFNQFASVRESDGDETFKASFVLRFFVLDENVVGEIFIDAFVELFIVVDINTILMVIACVIFHLAMIVAVCDLVFGDLLVAFCTFDICIRTSGFENQLMTIA